MSEEYSHFGEIVVRKLFSNPLSRPLIAEQRYSSDAHDAAFEHESINLVVEYFGTSSFGDAQKACDSIGIAAHQIDNGHRVYKSLDQFGELRRSLTEQVWIKLVQVSCNENNVRCQRNQAVYRLILVGADRWGLKIRQHTNSNLLPDAIDGKLHRFCPQPKRLDVSRIDAHRNRELGRETESRNGSRTLPNEEQYDHAS